MDKQQLKSLQADYAQRVKNFNKNAKQFAKEKKYDEAQAHKIRGEVYDICARDIKTLLNGKPLYGT